MRADKKDIQRADTKSALDHGAAQDDRQTDAHSQRKRQGNLTRREALVLRNQGDSEKLSDIPVEIPGKSDFERPLTLQEEMKRFIREEMSAIAQKNDAGTFSDEDDFSDDEPDMFLTQHTVVEMLPDGPAELANDLEGLTYSQLAEMAQRGLLEPDGSEILAPLVDRSEATSAEGTQNPEPARLSEESTGSPDEPPPVTST